MTHSPSPTGPRFWKIGELAEQTGLSVRTLHYYEEIGLLTPSYRTQADHRLYTEDDVTRLQQIVSLKSVGLPLEQIKMMLEQPTYSPLMTLQMQARHMDSQVREQKELLEKLNGMMRLMEHTGKTSAEDLLELIALMTRVEASYTPEQLEELRQRREKLGEAGMKKAENDWKELIAAMRMHMEKGTDPTDPAVQALGKKWMTLVRAFTGGDPAMEKQLRTMYEHNADAAAAFGGPGPEMMDYVQRIIDMQTPSRP